MSPAFPVPLCSTCQHRAKTQANKPFSCAWCGLDLRPQRASAVQQTESSTAPSPSPPPCLLFACGVGDKCRRKYCTRCITKHFGPVETRRIHTLKRSWECFTCDPEPLRRLCQTKWKITIQPKTVKNYRVISTDISNGREKRPIPVINEVDDSSPFPFTYIPKRIGVTSLKKRPDFMSCCSCTDNCADRTKCECAQAAMNNGSFAYDDDGVLVNEKPSGIYECNYMCSCNVNYCPNRVVGNGPQLPLEVFRCKPSGKGWGVRCKVNIQPGTFIADYIGEVIHEKVADKRGISYGDEYLFTLDAYGRSRGCQRLHDLGLKDSQQKEREKFYLPVREEGSAGKPTRLATSKTNLNEFNVPIFVSHSSKQYLEDVLGPDLVASIVKSSSVRYIQKDDEIELLGNAAVQRQSTSGQLIFSSESPRNLTESLSSSLSKRRKEKSSDSSSRNASSKKLKSSNKESKSVETPSPPLRKYNKDIDEQKMILRSRYLAQREARFVNILSLVHYSISNWVCASPGRS